jgi:gamma-glutamyltranspeptidase/glutathione hydrolase
MWSSEGHAKTLELIGQTMGEAFYDGSLTDSMINFSNQHGGFLSYEDFSDFDIEWVKPVSVNYKGYDVWELPPNGQGILALMALNMLKNDHFDTKDDLNTYHYQIEAMKLAFADGQTYITDPNHMNYTSTHLLDPTYGATRRKLIKDVAQLPQAGTPPKGGTVYLATADKDGNMVSYIQSNYMGFGSGIVIPETGIALQNRGHNFSFDPNHVNALQPRKKPYHTIIPGFLTKDNLPIGPFGVMGGFMQPQGHLQVIMNTIDFHLNPQAALDAPRWQWLQGNDVIVEPTTSNDIVEGLIAKGHNIRYEPRLSMFGRGQIIWKLENGIYVGGTEYRTDGMIASW